MYLVHSSGTTGFPKAVILRNDAQSHAVRGWLCYVHLSRTRDRGYVAVPNNHQAVILTFNSSLLLGLRVHWDSSYGLSGFDPSACHLRAGPRPVHRVLRIPDHLHPAERGRSVPIRLVANANLGEYRGCFPCRDPASVRRTRRRVSQRRLSGKRFRVSGRPGLQRSRDTIGASICDAIQQAFRPARRQAGVDPIRSAGANCQRRCRGSTRRSWTARGQRTNRLQGLLEQSGNDLRGHSGRVVLHRRCRSTRSRRAPDSARSRGGRDSHGARSGLFVADRRKDPPASCRLRRLCLRRASCRWHAGSRSRRCASAQGTSSPRRNFGPH